MNNIRLIPVIFATLLIIATCGSAEPLQGHPLDLIVPAPESAARLALYATTPDETVAEKISHLEHATRKANPNAHEWSIYLTPTAAVLPIRGWQADTNWREKPVPEMSLGQCLTWFSNTAGLRYVVWNSRVLIDVKSPEFNAQHIVPETSAVDTEKTKQKGVRKLICPRCQGNDTSKQNCAFCGKKGYIWVESAPDTP